ncbi:zinc finger protein 892 [Anabrus simplex]|uniref:zinc finger protein 892 n=1 Tax=Anabrus simplex TaxID=316456 RepID=UPI0035A2EFAF
MRCDGSASDGGFNVEAADNEAIPGSVIPSVFGESDLIIDTDITSTKNEAEKMPVRDFVSCDQCNFHTTSKSLLKSHLRKHSGTKPYGCKDCGKTFPQSSSLKVHMKRHRGQRDFPCDYDCDYRAYTKVDKIRHMTVHTGERNHVCQYCGKSFAKDCTLREHVKCVHERPTKHVCPKCGFSTFRANNLRVHINMRHRGEYDNHVCPVCGAKIKQKTAFLDHMRSHTGERPYSCHQCDSTFACIARLTVHRKAVHEPRQFTCKVCYKPFQTKHHLLRHSVIHTKEKPFGCPFCLYTCNTQGNVTKHVKTVHNKPDFSYRRYKEQQLVDADAKSVKSEWIEKGQKLTEEYLQQLSSKLGRSVTLSELQEREAEKMKQMSFELLQAKLKRINRIKRHEHSYHSNRMASDNDARLEEEAVDDPTALLLNVAQQISHDTGKDTEKPNSGIPLETENFASLNDESLAGISQTIFVQNSTEFQGDVVSDEYQAVLTTSEDNITSHVDPFVSSQTVELCVSEDTIDGDQPSLRLILPESEVESKERSRGKFAAMENEEYIQNFVTMKRNSQVNPTVVVIIKTENTPD